MVGPLREVGGAILVAQCCILSIGHKPLLGLVEELVIFLKAHHLLALLSEEQMEIFEFGVVDTLVVDLLQTIELNAQLFEAVALLGVLQLWQLCEVYIHRMQCKHADATIRIGVGPCVGDGAVVDRQDLQHALSGLVDIVDHLLQITEVTHAETCLGAK